MASVEEATKRYYDALDSGDNDLAEKIAQRFVDAGLTPPEPRNTKGESLAAGALQGATFGFGDEMQGMAGSMLDRLTGLGQEQAAMLGQEPPADYGYSGLRDAARQENRQARADNPMTYMGGELLGGLSVPGLGAFRGAGALARSLPRVAPAGGLAAAGAVEGGLAGAGYSEAEDGGELFGDVATGAGVGAVAAPLISGAASMVGRGGSNIMGGLSRRLFPDPDKQAAFRVKQALEYEGLNDVPAVRGALDALGPEGRLADAGPVLQRQAVSSSKVQGPGSKHARDFVDQRQAGQEYRLGSIARRELDPKWESYKGYLGDIKEQAKEQVSGLYEDAYKIDIQPTPELSTLSKTDAFQKAARQAQVNITNKVDRYGGDTGLRGDGNVGTPMMDQIARELSDAGNRALRAGSAEEAGDIFKIRKRLLAEVYKQNPTLERAMATWRGSKELENAAEFGREMLRGTKVRVDDLEEVMTGWSQSENEAFRIGLLQGIYDKLEDAAVTQSSAARVAPSSRVMKLLNKAFNREGGVDEFIRAVDAEKAMQDTRNRVIGGSPTAELMSTMSLPVDFAPGGGLIGTVQNVIRWLGRETAQTLTPDDHASVVKLLFSELSDDDIHRILHPTLRSRMKDASGVDLFSAPVGATGAQSIIGDDYAGQLFDDAGAYTEGLFGD